MQSLSAFPNPGNPLLMQPGDAVFAVSGGGHRASLPAAVITDIAAATPALPLPSADPLSPDRAFEGLVDDRGALTAQLDLAHVWGGVRGAGRYTLRVETVRGPLRVRVEAVSGPVAATDSLPDALADVEALVAGWPGVAWQPPPPPPVPPPPLAVLVLEAGGRRMALPAGGVEAVARLGAAWMPRGGGPGERVVALGEGLLPGRALADWLGVVPAAADAWAVIVRAGGRRLAITAERVHLPPPVPAASVHRLRLGEHDTVWLTQADVLPLELFLPDAFTGPAAAGFDIVPPAPEPPPPAVAPAAGGVALRAGPFGWVLSPSAVAGICPDASPGSVRSPGAVPVFDVAALFGRSGGKARSPALVLLRRPGRRPVALAAEAVTLTEPGAEWTPLPPAPAALHALFDAARPWADICQLRLRPAALARRGGGLPLSALRMAFRGWIDSAGLVPAATFAGAAPAGENKCSAT